MRGNYNIAFVAVIYCLGASVSIASTPHLYVDNICGPVVLSLVAKRHGIDCPMQKAIECVEMKSDGTSMAQLLLGARRLGLKAEAFEMTEASDLRRLSEKYSAIVQLNGDHFAAVWRKGKDVNVFSYPKPTSSFDAVSGKISNLKVLVIGVETPHNPFERSITQIIGILITTAGVVLACFLLARMKGHRREDD